MHSSRSADRLAARIGRLARLATATATLLLAGCIMVPLPGIKSGGIADGSTAASLPTGTPFADVLLRLGEPDSVSQDGRRIAYRWSRTWAVGAVGGNASAYPFVVERGSALLLTFDADDSLVSAETVNRWFHSDIDDRTLFYSDERNSALAPGVLATWPAVWHRSPFDPQAHSSGQAFLTAEALLLRPEHASDDGGAQTVRIPWSEVTGVEYCGSGIMLSHARPGNRLVVLVGSPQFAWDPMEPLAGARRVPDGLRLYQLAMEQLRHAKDQEAPRAPAASRSVMLQLVAPGERIHSILSTDGSQWGWLNEYDDGLTLTAAQLPEGTLTLRYADAVGCTRKEGTFTTRLVFSLPDGRRLVLGPTFGAEVLVQSEPGKVSQRGREPIPYYLARWQAARAKTAH